MLQLRDQLFNMLANTPLPKNCRMSLKALYQRTDLFWDYQFSEIAQAFEQLVKSHNVKGKRVKLNSKQEDWEFLGIL